MKEYYYLKGKEKNGPFTIAEINDKDLSVETFIWTEGMNSWEKIKNIPDLFIDLNSKLPPPLPQEVIENDDDDQPLKYNRLTPKERKPLSLKISLRTLIFWCSFHLFALLMSYTKINFFNSAYKSKSSEFWPFVKIIHTVDWEDYNNLNPEYIEEVRNNAIGKTEFHGLFYHCSSPL